MNYIISNSGLTVFVKGKSYAVSKDSKIWNSVLNAIRNEDEASLIEALDVKKNILSVANNKGFDIVDGEIQYNGRVITGVFSNRIFEMLEAQLNIEPMIKFIDNLMKNPSKRAVDELFGFMDACSLPVTPDGHFLAYKKVRSDYKDCYSGTIDNSVGNIVEMPRNDVDDDKDRTCSYGLHFCSESYLAHFGGERIVVLKINPADVVSIPSDYNNAKGRCCKYEVVDELENSGKIADGFVQEYDWSDEIEASSLEADPKTISVTQKIDSGEAAEIRWLTTNSNLPIAKISDLYQISERQVRRIRDNEAWVDAGSTEPDWFAYSEYGHNDSYGYC